MSLLKMNIYKIETGNFKLDGGAMFGVVPKVLWNKVYPADENNLCNLAMRCLLLKTKDRLILIDTGIGEKQTDKFFSYYYLNGDNSIDASLKNAGFNRNDISDVILTHLHFDHCGGALMKDEQNNYTPAFSNADYWVSKPQWNWAMHPNKREKASYLQENIEPLAKCGKLRLIDNSTEFSDEIQLRLYGGHTDGLIVPFIKYKDRILVFVTDLIPTSAHIPASWICGYDTRPLLSMEERESFLFDAEKNNYVLFFEHDIYHECCKLKQIEKGIGIDRFFSLSEFLSS
jgi:glyoxylase-like metal-dependent hydrolase (beta-lactamase superfamily II)